MGDRSDQIAIYEATTWVLSIYIDLSYDRLIKRHIVKCPSEEVMTNGRFYWTVSSAFLARTILLQILWVHRYTCQVGSLAASVWSIINAFSFGHVYGFPSGTHSIKLSCGPPENFRFQYSGQQKTSLKITLSPIWLSILPKRSSHSCWSFYLNRGIFIVFQEIVQVNSR